jgi:hypothetical protein
MTPHAFNFTDFVNNVIVADDNNGTLCDNTPNTSQIRQAFETNHGISPTNLPTTLKASITGPSALAPGQTGTWTANPCPSQGSFSYEWRFRVVSGSWSGVVGTAQTFSKSDYSSFDLEAKVTGLGQQAYAYYYVTVGGLPKQSGEEFAQRQTILPADFELLQNYPNPFNPETAIGFGLPAETHVQVIIFDLVGRDIRKLVDQNIAAGYHGVVWDGKDHSGNEVPSGIYFYKFVAGTFQSTKKLMLLR